MINPVKCGAIFYLDKRKITSPIWPALSMSIRASKVSKFFLYDYWWDGTTLELSKKRTKRKEISLLKILERTGVIEIGR